MKFQWDPEKEKINIAKHHINFKIASRVFDDYYRIERYDDVHSLYEDRYLTIGEINGACMVITVIYTEREKTIRIISARLATKAEKEEYYDCRKRHRF